MHACRWWCDEWGRRSTTFDKRISAVSRDTNNSKIVAITHCHWINSAWKNRDTTSRRCLSFHSVRAKPMIVEKMKEKLCNLPECNECIALFTANDMNSAFGDVEIEKIATYIRCVCWPGKILKSNYECRHFSNLFSVDWCDVWRFLEVFIFSCIQNQRYRLWTCKWVFEKKRLVVGEDCLRLIKK